MSSRVLPGSCVVVLPPVPSLYIEEMGLIRILLTSLHNCLFRSEHSFLKEKSLHLLYFYCIQLSKSKERDGRRAVTGASRPAGVDRKESSPDPVFMLILKGRTLRVLSRLLSEATCEAQASWPTLCMLLSLLEAFAV